MISEDAERFRMLAQDVPGQAAGWIDNELEDVMQRGLTLLGEGHPLRIEFGSAVVARQREANALRTSLQGLMAEIEGFADGLE
jgi:hypothetical protein